MSKRGLDFNNYAELKDKIETYAIVYVIRVIMIQDVYKERYFSEIIAFSLNHNWIFMTERILLYLAVINVFS